tara:strand:- start:776 stop:1153 length:378 start_codon:yes stop_codon:yes gene_type:complete
MLGNLIFLLAIQLLSLPFFALFFNLSIGSYLWPLLLVFLLGSSSLAAVGTLFAAMSNNMRLRELLLPLLLLPLILPALLSCVAGTAAVLAQNQHDKLYVHLQMLGVYTVVFTTLSFLLFEFVIEE